MEPALEPADDSLAELLEYPLDPELPLERDDSDEPLDDEPLPDESPADDLPFAEPLEPEPLLASDAPPLADEPELPESLWNPELLADWLAADVSAADEPPAAAPEPSVDAAWSFVLYVASFEAAETCVLSVPDCWKPGFPTPPLDADSVGGGELLGSGAELSDAPLLLAGGELLPADEPPLLDVVPGA